MIIFQATVFCIILVYYFYWFVRENDRVTVFQKLAVISVASWIAEETSIRFYHFYQYSSDWGIFIGHVPLLVILVWPIVIHSGWELAYQIMNKNKQHAHLAAAIIIWIDASLIETIAVKFGFWSWNAPGIWDVPLMGIFGWLFFAFLSIFIIKPRNVGKTDVIISLFIILMIVSGTHVMIITTWWLIFRWILFPVNLVFVTTAAWCLSLLLVYFIHRDNLGDNMDNKVMMIRVPPAILFLIVYIKGSPSVMHTAYLSAFCLPYFLLIYKILKRAGARKTKA